MTLLRQYFFQDSSAYRLGVSRALFYAWCLIQVWAYQPWDWGHLPAEFWSPPFLMFPFSPPSPNQTLATCALMVITLITSCLGLFTRFSVLLAAPLLTYNFGVVCSYGWTSFHHSPLILISWVLAFSHCGHAFSIDALRDHTERPDHGEYCWPIRMSWLVLVSLMCCAGFHKLSGGWPLQPAETMEWVFLFKYSAQAAQKSIVLPDLVFRLAKTPLLMHMMGWATLILELFSPLALWSRRPRLQLFFISGLFCMQLSLALMSTLVSFPWLAAYVFWVPWKRPKAS